MLNILTLIKGLALYQKVLLGTAAVALVCAGFVSWKHHYDNQIISHAVDKANANHLKKEARANDKAAEARASDTIQLNKLDQERKDAIATTTDQPPSDADRALNCRRLQQSGYDISGFPSCS